uniref:Gamma-aminobutyric acid receptor subunit beta-1-like n=1 Tax=Saccoglossus kowalevskii TaxID=10224 RepID=A0ABM0MPM9_SACKO|nr:PREDICTED: gamma-aminobutyric acid receptor subunit beta-1-like [Saccoglossus kowalevskii]
MVVFVMWTVGSVKATLRRSSERISGYSNYQYSLYFRDIDVIYNTDDIRLNWGWGRTGNVTAIMDSEVSLPGFTLHETTTTKQEIPFPMGIYDRLICRFDLYRQIIYYVMEYYVPSFLLVILSWVSFWLSVESTPARASLGITTVLTLTTLSSLARTQLPRITYLTAIDVWILVCSLFVFAALLEFAVASYVAIHFNKSYSTSRSCHNRAKSSAEQVSVMATLSSSDMEEGKASLTRRSFRSSKTGSSNCTATLIDNCSRVLFPVSFILFNVVYWLKYGLVL